MVSKSRILTNAIHKVFVELSWYGFATMDDIHTTLTQELNAAGFAVHDPTVFVGMVELMERAIKLDTLDLEAREKHLRLINALGAQCLVTT